MDGSMDLCMAEKMRAEREQRGGHAARQETVAQLLEQLNDQLDLLRQRLSPVLVPELPATPGELRGLADSPDSELAGFFRHVTERLQSTVTAVRVLSDRVDL